MAGNHARLSPSNHRWVHCPGSVREEAVYEKITNASAIDGTGSHLLLEKCLKNDLDPGFYLGTVIGVNHPDKPSGWIVNKDRIERVEYCLNYIERRKKELRKEYPLKNYYINVSSETKSNPGELFGRDDWWGTVDITISVHLIYDNSVRFIEVVDFKDGRGYVDVQNNPQLIAYMAGKMPETVRRTVSRTRLTIVQPKTNPVIRSQDLTREEILEKVLKLNEAAQKTDDPNAPLISGKHCTWCSHKEKCSAIKDKTIERLGVFMKNTEVIEGNQLFESIETMFKDINSMSSDQLGQLLDAQAAINNIFKQASEEIERRLSIGEKVSGYALLPGNGKNQWKIEEEELVKVLKARKFKKEDIYISKLISPAQVLSSPYLTKEQKSKFEKEYIEYVPGKLSLKQVERKEETSLDIFDDVLEESPTEEISFI